MTLFWLYRMNARMKVDWKCMPFCFPLMSWHYHSTIKSQEFFSGQVRFSFLDFTVAGSIHFVTTRQQSYGKVMFSVVSVHYSIRRGTM